MLSQPKGSGGPGNGLGPPPKHRAGGPRVGEPGGEPGWAGGLRKLYNSVVEEPLPDSFKDLLKKLDDGDNG
nr:NepR family anti-sigma factor [Novosphingobium sp. Rr 2-17]